MCAYIWQRMRLSMIFLGTKIKIGICQDQHLKDSFCPRGWFQSLICWILRYIFSRDGQEDAGIEPRKRKKRWHWTLENTATRNWEWKIQTTFRSPRNNTKHVARSFVEHVSLPMIVSDDNLTQQNAEKIQPKSSDVAGIWHTCPLLLKKPGIVWLFGDVLLALRDHYDHSPGIQPLILTEKLQWVKHEKNSVNF